MSRKHGFVLFVLAIVICAAALAERPTGAMAETATSVTVANPAVDVVASTGSATGSTSDSAAAVDGTSVTKAVTSGTDASSGSTATATDADATVGSATGADGSATDAAATGSTSDATAGATTSATLTDATSTTTATPADATATTASDTASSQTSVSTQTEDATVADGLYEIVSGASQTQYLDIDGGSTDNGARAQIWESNSTAAQRWRVSAAGDGYYTVQSVASGKYLDVAGANASNGAAVQQYSGNGTAAQLWKIAYDAATGLYSFISKLSSSLVLDDAGGNTSNGNKVQLYTANGTLAQRWGLSPITEVIKTGCYVTTNVGSGKVIDIAGGSLDAAGNVQQYQANGTMAQTFYYEYDSSTGYYRIVGVESGLSLDVAGASNQSGANVQQYSYNTSRAQMWSIRQNADGTLTLLSAVGGKALDVAGGSRTDAANLQVWLSNGTDAQKWKVAAVSDWLASGSYQIVTRNNSSNDLAVEYSSVTSGSLVTTRTRAQAQPSQVWEVVKGTDGYCRIVNLNSGLVLDVTGASSANGTAVQQYDGNGSDAQLWKPVMTSTGVKLVSRLNDSVVLDVRGNSTSVGSKMDVYATNGSSAQRFCFVSAPLVCADVAYAVVSGVDAKVLDVSGASIASGATVQLYEYNGTKAQQFRFVSVGDGLYRIVNVNSGLVLSCVGDGTFKQVASADYADQYWKVGFDDDTDSLSIVSASGKGALVNEDSKLSLSSTSLTSASATDSTEDIGSFFLRVLANALNGIDIASWEAGIDLSAVPADFVIVKSTQGTNYTNPYYASWASEVLSLGKSLGIYHYADGSGAVAEADAFVSSVQSIGAVGRALLALDWESVSNAAFGSGSSAVSYCLTFLNRVYERIGVRPVIYMSRSVTNDGDWSSVSNAGYQLWMAQYLNRYYDETNGIDGYVDDPEGADYACGSWNSPAIYQYTSTGNLSNYGGWLDLDKFYGSAADWYDYARVR